MRFLYVNLVSDIRGYRRLAGSGDSVDDLSCFLRTIGYDFDILLKMIAEDDINVGVSGSYIFTVEPNIYIGYEFDGLTEGQSIVLKDDGRYFFRTTKQGFIDLINKRVKVHEQRPPGISIKETSKDVWQVKAMTEQQVAHYKSIADPISGLLPDDEAKS